MCDTDKVRPQAQGNSALTGSQVMDDACRFAFCKITSGTTCPSACSAILFYFYPGVTEEVLSIFQCENIDNPDLPYAMFSRTNVRMLSQHAFERCMLSKPMGFGSEFERYFCCKTTRPCSKEYANPADGSKHTHAIQTASHTVYSFASSVLT